MATSQFQICDLSIPSNSYILNSRIKFPNAFPSGPSNAYKTKLITFTKPTANITLPKIAPCFLYFLTWKNCAIFNPFHKSHTAFTLSLAPCCLQEKIQTMYHGIQDPLCKVLYLFSHISFTLCNIIPYVLVILKYSLLSQIYKSFLRPRKPLLLLSIWKTPIYFSRLRSMITFSIKIFWFFIKKSWVIILYLPVLTGTCASNILVTSIIWHSFCLFALPQMNDHL